jgi:hypothetical protein
MFALLPSPSNLHEVSAMDVEKHFSVMVER